ncbi:MAG: flagellar basal body L-ring protein FlgH [Planctomycetota bacterium]
MHRCSHSLLLHSLALALTFGASTMVDAQSRVAQGQDGDRSVYIKSEKKRPALAKNDIILILVKEETKGDVGSTLDAKRKTELTMLIDSFARFQNGDLKPNFNPTPELELEAESKTRGSGKTNRKDRIDTRVAARVVDVLPNGNVRLEARSERTINDETTVLTLSGEVREVDVSAENSVLSDRMADLKLSYSGDGPVSGKTKQTWFVWLIDHIWPF